MPRQHHELTPQIQQAIVSYIRAGGFPQVAAEATGVPRAVFERWLRRGQARRAPARYRAFHAAVRQAEAQARLNAEVAILSGKPLDWLRSGPGRATTESPGWTASVRPLPLARAPGASAELQPEVQALVTTLLHLLEPYPEARTAVAAPLAQVSVTAPPRAADAS
jgi:hypothetical protein